jgi:hypothetical protein
MDRPNDTVKMGTAVDAMACVSGQPVPRLRSRESTRRRPWRGAGDGEVSLTSNEMWTRAIYMTVDIMITTVLGAQPI